jgi:hypothetical protein
LSWSPTTFSRSVPIGLPPVPWTEKVIERSPLFIQHSGHCCRGDLVGQTTFWNFFKWLAKLEQLAKKFIELRGEYVQWILRLVTVACFLPGQAKDLTAPPRTDEWACKI